MYRSHLIMDGYSNCIIDNRYLLPILCKPNSKICKYIIKNTDQSALIIELLLNADDPTATRLTNKCLKAGKKERRKIIYKNSHKIASLIQPVLKKLLISVRFGGVQYAET